MAQKLRFELIAGQHSNAHGNYVKGDIVESHSDLEAKFVNKFRRRKDLEVAAPTPVVAPKVDKKSAAPAPSPAAVADDDAGDEDDKTEADSDDAPPAKATSKLGENVTAEYPAAREAELLVLKSGKDYFVADTDQPDKALNKKAVKKDGVDAFIKQYIG